MKKYLDIWQLKKTYDTPDGDLVVVEDFNLTLERGEFVCLIGHSGCGKSTVLSMVAGLSEPTAGVMILGGREVTGPGTDRGVVFQAPCLLPWLTVRGNVLLGVDEAMKDRPRKERIEVADHYLKLVGLGDSIHKNVAELSGGMRQRVGLARAFALSPKMLLLDEPFGMLDSLTRFGLQQVLIDLWSQDRKTALMVTHDVDEALFLSDRIVMMTNGPSAKVGEVMQVSFPRPRDRQAVMEDPSYYVLRERLIEFLEDEGRRHGSREVEPEPESTAAAGDEVLEPSLAPLSMAESSRGLDA